MKELVVISVILHFAVAYDPCTNHQVLYEETWRSVAYIWQSGMETKCDATITEDWYKVNSTAGEDVITSCPPVDRCGTRSPIWMNGTLPNEADGIVDRTMCVSTLFDCCESHIEIQIKNCSTYNVYYLKQSSCPQAYCFGTRLVTTHAPPTSSVTMTTREDTGNDTDDDDDDDNDDDEPKERHTWHKLWLVVAACVTVIVIVLIVSITVVIYKIYKPRVAHPYIVKVRPQTPPPPYLKGDGKHEDYIKEPPKEVIKAF